MDNKYDNISRIMAGFIGLACMFMMFYVLVLNAKSHSEKRDRIQEIKENPQRYEFYLDGEEVKFDKININAYDIEIKGNEVLLSRKLAPRSVVPIVIP